MYGEYSIPMSIERDGLKITIERDGNSLLYRRDCLEEKVEKRLLAGDGKVLLNPVEPLNRPKVLTPHLLVAFEKSLVVEPRISEKIFVTFPIEIGVYISTNKEFQLIDVFTFTRPKFTVYGDPRNGVLCKYWESGIHSSMPSTDPFHEGLIELNISNAIAVWIEITKSIFNANGMKIYYNDRMVTMKADMKIRAGNIAETEFTDAPLEHGMTNSLEIYTARRLSVTSPKFIMEYGL